MIPVTTYKAIDLYGAPNLSQLQYSTCINPSSDCADASIDVGDVYTDTYVVDSPRAFTGCHEHSHFHDTWIYSQPPASQSCG